MIDLRKEFIKFRVRIKRIIEEKQRGFRDLELRVR